MKAQLAQLVRQKLVNQAAYMAELAPYVGLD